MAETVIKPPPPKKKRLLYARSGLTLKFILYSSEYLSQLLSLRDNHGQTFRGVSVSHVLIIMKRSSKRFENVHVLT
jgi:hypothetical protein